MKIAFVNDTFLEGRGADTVIYELAKELGKRHEVYVLASESNFKEDNFKIIKLELQKLYTGKISDFNYLEKIKKLRKQIFELQKRYHFELFNVHHIALNPAFIKLPTIVTWHGSPPTKNIFRKILMRLLLRTLRNNKKTIVISKFLYNQISFLKERVTIIPNGVSADFKPKWKDKEYMLYVGRLEKHKNIEDLIRLSKETNFKLKIVGYGPEEDRLKKFFATISAPVEFLGKVSRKELVNLYQECSFFVSASKWEGFGLIFLEAAACGKPSIGYNVGATPEVIMNNETGFLVNNYKEFKESALKLIKDEKTRIKMGKKAFEFSKNFNWKEIVKKYEKVFKEVRKNENT